MRTSTPLVLTALALGVIAVCSATRPGRPVQGLPHAGTTPVIGAPDARAASGALEARFTGFDAWDRLWLRARPAAGARQHSIAVADGAVMLMDLPAGACALELTTADGEVLAQATAEVPETGRASVTLDWPEPLARPRARRLQGELVVPLLARESPIGERLVLALVPALDSPEQRRAGVRSRHVPVRGLTSLGDDRLAFEFDGVAVGTYELRLEPLCHAQSVVLERGTTPVHVRVDPGLIGCSMLSFTDEAGRAVRPQSVEVFVPKPFGAPISVPLDERPEWEAFEWLGVPGEYELRVRDPRYGRRVMRLELVEGWSDLAVTLRPAHRVRLALDLPEGMAAPPPLERFEVLALSGGEVFSVWNETVGGAHGGSALVFEVGRPGTYLARCRLGGDRALHELCVEVQGSGPVEQTWALGEPRAPR